MKSKLSTVAIGSWFLLSSGVVFANPAMLPNHPGYPMGDAKDPVTGLSVANDPGKSPPSQEEALKQAATFHDAQAVNPSQEIRPNIVPPEQEKSKNIDAAGKPSQ